MTSELAACSYCGGTGHVLMEEIDNHFYALHAECNHCHVGTKPFYTKENPKECMHPAQNEAFRNAVDFWNYIHTQIFYKPSAKTRRRSNGY